jgi:hypothetical protein
MRMLLALAVLVTHLSHAGVPRVLIHPVEYYLPGPDAFLEDGKGNFYRDSKGHPVSMRGTKPWELPPGYPVWNKAQTFVFDLTKTYSIPLDAPIHTKEQFAAVIQLLAETEIGLMTIKDLMWMEEITETCKRAYPVVGGERGVRVAERESNVSVVDLIPAPDGMKLLRDSTPVKIEDGVIYFTPGLEAGELAAALLFASQTDQAAGFASLNVNHGGDVVKNTLGSHDYEGARQAHLHSSEKLVRKARDEKLFGVVITVFDGLRAIALNEKQYGEDRLSSILYQGHRAMHEFMVQLSNRIENREQVQSYFRERQKSEKLRGIIAPLSKPEVAEGYGLLSTVSLSQFEEKAEQKRCQDWLLGVRKTAAGLLDPEIRATVERFDDQSDINR